jgi:hypothetical protein
MFQMGIHLVKLVMELHFLYSLVGLYVLYFLVGLHLAVSQVEEAVKQNL